jgi:two-component system cell cycle response regulator
MNILIIDDSDNLRGRVKDLLVENNNTLIVAEASCKEEAGCILKEKKIDVAIIDIHLKEENGLEILKQIKQDPRNNNIIVIVYTNHPFEHYKNASINLGADYFVGKFEEMDKLVSIINNIENIELKRTDKL